jgi:hypothetical protein
MRVVLFVDHIEVVPVDFGLDYEVHLIFGED